MMQMSLRRFGLLRDHGQAQKYYHEMEGYNGRLDSIQAGILRIKLRHLATWNEERRECARRYAQLLGPANEGLVLPASLPGSRQFTIFTWSAYQNRDRLQKPLWLRHWYWNSLSDSPSPARSVQEARLQER